MNGEAIDQEDDEYFGVARCPPSQKCCIFLEPVFANGIFKGGLNAPLQHSIYMRFQRVVVPYL